MSDSKGAAIDEALQLAGNLAIKTANKYLEEDLKLGLIERLRLPEETDFSKAKQAILAILAQEVKRVIGEDEDLEVLKPLPGMQKDAWARNGLRAEMRRKAGLV